MTISFMAGRRIQGLDSDLTATQLPSGSVGGWVEIDRNTLSSSANSISVDNLTTPTTYRYYMVLMHTTGLSSNNDVSVRFNDDAGSTNYSRRWSYGGNTGGSTTSLSSTAWHFAQDAQTTSRFSHHYISNLASKYKLAMSFGVRERTSGAGYYPDRFEGAGSWKNSTDAISKITALTETANTFNAGTQMVVLGYDPTSTHTTNFWKKLKTATASGTTTDLSVEFVAKKYLWVQFTGKSSSTAYVYMRMNDDAGASYSYDLTQDGNNTPDRSVNNNSMFPTPNASGDKFVNMFIANPSNYPKLVYSNSANITTAGAGTVASRREYAGKWASNDQVTKLTFTASAGNLTNYSTVTVWGSD